MTTTEIKTRPIENTITRRKMLQSIAITSSAALMPAAVASLPSAALAKVGETISGLPLASRLAKRVAAALAVPEIDGRWSVTIVSGDADQPIWFNNLDRPNKSADAELIELGAEYAQLNSENRVLLAQMDPLHSRLFKEMDKRNLSLTTHVAEIQALEDEIGLTQLQHQNDTLCDKMGGIEQRCRSLRPTSVAGIRAKLLIAYGTLGPSYSIAAPHVDQDWHLYMFNELFADLDRLAG